MDSYIFLVETFIREILFKIKGKVMVNFFGLIVAFTKGNGGMEFKTEKVKFIQLEETLLVVFLKIVYQYKQCLRFMKNRWKYQIKVFMIYLVQSRRSSIQREIEHFLRVKVLILERSQLKYSKQLERRKKCLLLSIIDCILNHHRKVKLVIKVIDNVNVRRGYKISV